MPSAGEARRTASKLVCFAAVAATVTAEGVSLPAAVWLAVVRVGGLVTGSTTW